MRFSVGETLELVELGEKATLGALFSARFDGVSTVVLPLEDSSCKALKKALNPLSLKGVVPLAGLKDLVSKSELKARVAGRIAEMKTGEVWKLPVEPSVAWGPSVTAPLGTNATVHAHWTFRTARGQSVSLKRLSESQVRFRYRVDAVKLEEKALAVSGSVTADDLGVGGRLAYKQAISLFNQYFKARIGVSGLEASGREILLEYVLDPRDPAQMEALVKAAAGDLSVLGALKAMFKSTGKLLASDEAARESLEKLKEEHDGDLGTEATFAAGNVYDRRATSFDIHVPFLFRFDSRRSSEGSERITLLDEKGGSVHLYPAHDRIARGLLEIPILGDLDRYERSSSVAVYAYSDAEGRRDSPNAVYLEQRAFTREGAWTPNAMLESINEVMRWTGARAGKADASKELPVARFRSVEPPGPKPSSPKFAEVRRSVLYEKGMSDFTLILSRKAIADILAASKEDVRAAYVAALSEAEKKLFRRGEAGLLLGGVTKDNRQVRHAEQSSYARMAREAAALAHGVENARGAADPDAQAAALRDLISGSAGPSYADVLKVLIQFADPADVAGIADIQVRGSEKDDSLRKRFVFNEGGADSDLVRAYAAARARFLKPSTTSD